MMGPDERPDSPSELSISDYNVSSHPLGAVNHEDPLLPSPSDDRNSEEEDEPLFASFGSEQVNGNNALNLNHQQEQEGSSTNGEFFDIFVSQPKKEADSSSSSLIPGGSYFVTYLITTRTNLPEYRDHKDGELSVRRRFKDIVALADSLLEKYRGYFVPPRPEKNLMESQLMDKHEFIEQRMLGIQRYLTRLAAHPVLRRSEELRTFLVSKGKLPLVPRLDVASRMLDGAAKLPRQLFGDAGTVASPQEVVHSAKGGRDLLRLFKELKQSVTNDWSSAKPLVVEEDKDFLEKKEMLREYERRVAHVAQQVDCVMKAQTGLSVVLGDLGLAFVKLGKFETQQARNGSEETYAATTRHVSTTVIRAGRIVRGSASQAEKHLSQFHEHQAILQMAHAAFVDRNNALLTVHTLLSDIAMMHAKAEKHSAAALKVFGGDKSRNKKVEDLKENIKVTEQACETAQQQYNQIQERNREEIDRIERDKSKEHLLMFQGLVRSQVNSAGKLAREWTKLAEDSAQYSGRRLNSLMFKSSPSFPQ